ncbi:Por secretion system C-terminal sorting domain-containing protein [Dyadobacter sp. SG02]|uniref:T9SS type A sorting domain-containing protein n=1 Tax=Dyadobacter sp. SG02 TaxID=1855291 RepID=UPI0008B8B63D|nr:T9SS type A sorting domain-containing protein [Dyadobacter sp. SG02]SEI54854.1 Por secretion system C-terminal sorting domain-containing protein [Dyadobacter sp. SG02]
MKRLIILTLISVIAGNASGQNTTYGGASAPATVDGGRFSDYSPGGTVVLADGSVALANNSVYEHGNNLLQVNGSWTATGSLDLFVAPGANTISGNMAPSFSKARFNIGAGNTMAITNTQGVNITDSLYFNNGITTTARNTHTISALRFGDGAFYTGGNTDAQHVNGYVTKTGDDAFLFPVGNGADLRTVLISAPSAPAAISTAWFAGSPDNVADPSDGSTHSLTALASSLKAVSPVGFWDWAVTAGNDDNIFVTVSMPDVSTFAIPSDLRLAGWDGTRWISLSASGNAIGNTENSTLSGIIPAGVTISALAIGSSEPPLPVTLVSFTARAAEQTALLEWETTEEVNASHFEIQRSSDAKNFEAIGTVEAAGDSRDLVSYRFTDASPLAGINYYRLKQIDRAGDGQEGPYSYSRTVSVRFDVDVKISVYPNPATDLIRIESAGQLGTVEIFTLTGARLTGARLSGAQSLQNPGSGAACGFQKEINISAFQPGIYLLKVNGQTFKIVKQ